MTSPVRDLSAAADNVRTFNRATFSTGGPDWRYPPQACTAIGNLSQLVSLLEQAINQSTVPVEVTWAAGRLLIDGGSDSTESWKGLVSARKDAEAAARALTNAVQRMHNAVSPMGLDTTGLPEFIDEDDEEP